jgi:hypothetical protein
MPVRVSVQVVYGYWRLLRQEAAENNNRAARYLLAARKGKMGRNADA